VNFGILGPLEIRANGRVVPPGGAKQQTLLAALLLEPNRVVAAERLVELLWGDGPPETAVNNLQVYVSQLRRTLEPERAPGARARLWSAISCTPRQPPRTARRPVCRYR